MRMLTTHLSSLTAILLILLVFPPTTLAQQSAANYFMDGVEAYDMGSYQEAISSLKKAIELEPSNLEFQYYLGLTYSAIEQYDEALRVFESIAETEPVTFRKAYFEIAAIYSRQGNYQKAIDTLTIVEDIDPEDARVYIEKGYAFQKSKQYNKAIQSFNAAKELDPKMLQVASYNIAAVHFEVEEFDKAEEMFQKAIEVDPATTTAENARQALVNVRKTKRARKPWYLSASFTWSYDDNVFFKALEQAAVVSPTGETLDEGDQFQSLFFIGGYRFINKKELQVDAGYSLYCIGYQDLVENNVMGHIPHLSLTYNRHPFYLRVPYEFSYYSTGGEENGKGFGFFLAFGGGAEKKLGMHELSPTLTIVEPHNLKSEITLTYQDKDYLDDVTPDASQYALAIVQHYKFPTRELYPRAGYKYGSENASEDIYSYAYHQFLIGLASSLLWDIRGDVSLTYERISFERNPYYSTEGERKDSKYIVGVTLTRPLSEIFSLTFSYSHTRSDSNVSEDGIDPFEFKKNVYGLMITGLF